MSVTKRQLDEKKPRKSTPKYQNNTSFRGFVNVELTKEQRDAFSHWFDASLFWDAVHAFIMDGYKFSLKYEPKNETIACYMQTDNPDSPNSGLVLSMRHEFAWKAIARTVYVADAVLGEVWDAPQRVDRSSDDW